VNKETLKAILFVKGLRPAGLAKLCGLPRQTVHRWLNAQGESINLESKNLQSVANALGLEADDLLTPIADLKLQQSQHALFLWDRLFPNFLSFAVALAKWHLPAVGRLVQTLGLFQSEKILGKRIWRDFDKYKHFLHPAVRKNWEAVWLTQKSLNLI